MIVPFYLGEQPDSEGRAITEIWAWNFEKLEKDDISLKQIKVK
ncbi:MAG: hypothetical protein RM338_30860 [Nostoc sp. DedQUE12a]|nr:hypothetical protein [Nostoc sp. DedQUE12a]